MSFKIVVIGVGNIGFRHFQSLLPSQKPFSVTLVDPSGPSLEKCKKLLDANSPHSVSYCNSIAQLEGTYDLAIVATSSDIRKSVIEALISKCNIRYLILEKFLFQAVEDFEHVGCLLQSHKISAWVNCPRRMWPAYIELKDRFINSRKASFSVSAGLMGLGCNAIHFLDLFSFWSGETEFDVVTERLDLKIYPSKRTNFSEFHGTLLLRSERTQAEITSFETGSPWPVFNIQDDVGYITIEEEKGIIRENVEKTFNIPYQSQLTLKVIDHLMESGTSMLPTFEESAHLHLLLLSALKKHMTRVLGREVVRCPIT